MQIYHRHDKNLKIYAHTSFSNWRDKHRRCRWQHISNTLRNCTLIQNTKILFANCCAHQGISIQFYISYILSHVRHIVHTFSHYFHFFLLSLTSVRLLNIHITDCAYLPLGQYLQTLDDIKWKNKKCVTEMGYDNRGW